MTKHQYKKDISTDCELADIGGIIQLSQRVDIFSEIDDDYVKEWMMDGIVRVIYHRGIVAAFSIVDIHKHSFQIVDVTVHPKLRRRGYGTILACNTMKRIQPSSKRQRVFANIPFANLDALRFFCELGFEVTEQDTHYLAEWMT